MAGRFARRILSIVAAEDENNCQHTVRQHASTFGLHHLRLTIFALAANVARANDPRTGVRRDQRLMPCRRQAHASTQTKLRILRQGSAATSDGCVHLHVRMYVLRALRRERAVQRMSKLRWWFRATAHSPGHRTAAECVSRQTAGVYATGPFVLGSGRTRAVRPRRPRHQARTALGGRGLLPDRHRDQRRWSNTANDDHWRSRRKKHEKA